MPYHLVPGISYLSFVRFNTVLASPYDYLDGIRENVKLQKLHWYPQNITKLASAHLSCSFLM